MSLSRWMRRIFGASPPPESPTYLEAEAAWNPDLFAAVRDAPDDPAPFAVLADWLIEQGDPRGVAINAALQADPIDAVLATYAPHFFGPLLEAKPRSITPDEPFYTEFDRWSADRTAVVGWKHGFVDRLWIPMAYSEWSIEGIGPEVADVLANPSFWLLRELVFGGAMFDGLPEFPPLPTVRRLRIGDFIFPEECEMSWSVLGDWSDVRTRFPNLVELHVQGGLEALDIPDGIERFVFETSTGASDVVRGFLPRLSNARSVELWTGATEYGANVTVEDLEPLCTMSLEHLALKNSEVTDAFVARLVDAPVLAGLKTLDLSLGTLTDIGARMLLAHADRFAHLERLDLDENAVMEQADALRAAFGSRVSLERQDAYDGEPFVSVAE